MRLLRRRLRLVALVVGLVGAAVAWYKVPRLEVFSITHVSIIGASAVPDPTIRNSIDSLLADQTIYTLDSDAVQRRVRRLPFVHRAKVVNHFPNSISIEITEYAPLAYAFSGNKGWLVARDGRVLTRAEREDWVDTIPIVRLEHAGVQAGDRVGGEPALRLLRATPATFPGTFKRVEFDKRGFIGYLHDGPEIRFGRDSDLPQKLLVAQRLLSLYGHAQLSSIKYVDVSVPSRPAVNPPL